MQSGSTYVHALPDDLQSLLRPYLYGGVYIDRQAKLELLNYARVSKGFSVDSQMALEKLRAFLTACQYEFSFVHYASAPDPREAHPLSSLLHFHAAPLGPLQLETRRLEHYTGTTQWVLVANPILRAKLRPGRSTVVTRVIRTEPIICYFARNTTEVLAPTSFQLHDVLVFVVSYAASSPTWGCHHELRRNARRGVVFRLQAALENMARGGWWPMSPNTLEYVHQVIGSNVLDSTYPHQRCLINSHREHEIGHILDHCSRRNQQRGCVLNNIPFGRQVPREPAFDIDMKEVARRGIPQYLIACVPPSQPSVVPQYIEVLHYLRDRLGKLPPILVPSRVRQVVLALRNHTEVRSFVVIPDTAEHFWCTLDPHWEDRALLIGAQQHAARDWKSEQGSDGALDLLRAIGGIGSVGLSVKATVLLTQTGPIALVGRPGNSWEERPSTLVYLDRWETQLIRYQKCRHADDLWSYLSVPGTGLGELPRMQWDSLGEVPPPQV
jgi:hypothetical protein